MNGEPFKLMQEIELSVSAQLSYRKESMSLMIV
jgi:hypothetical protein